LNCWSEECSLEAKPLPPRTCLDARHYKHKSLFARGNRFGKIAELLPYFVHAGAICYLVCFLFSNQIYLRLLAIMGDLFYFAFYFGVADKPLWQAMIYCILNICVNIYMIYFLLSDRRQGVRSEQENELFKRIDTLNPGQFRRLMKLAVWHKADSFTAITEENSPLREIHYVLLGEAKTEKVDPKSMQHDGIAPGFFGFVGEVAFVTGKPALATTKIAPGTVYVSWNCDRLRELFEKDDDLKKSLLQAFSADMALKITRLYNKNKQLVHADLKWDM